MLAARSVRTSRMLYACRPSITIWFLAFRSGNRLVDIKVLKSGARDNHVLCSNEGYQSEATVACFPMQAVFSDCWAKNPFSTHFRIKIAKQNFYIGSGSSVIQNLEFVVKGILGCVILILRRRMGTYKANVKIFCLNADGG